MTVRPRAINAAYGELYRDIQSQIKKRAGVFGTWDAASKQRSQTVSDYRKWTAAAEAIWEEATNEKAS